MLTREVPPTISTSVNCSFFKFASSKANSIGCLNLATRELARASNSSLVNKTLKSLSSAKHSTLILTSFTPAGERVFFAFSAAACNFKTALIFLRTSIPVYIYIDRYREIYRDDYYDKEEEVLMKGK